ncbi:MAG TPA: hypothetical protein DCR40_14970, partial [Prolixibacteraceae bacterium]|nr:hypothetical protein [Prolixibacteraceae bacterium]
MPIHSSSEEQFLKKLTELTEANLTNEQFGVSELAREMNMSRSNLHRKVIFTTKTSVSQFIRQHRLKRAMEMLQQTALTVSEVAYQVGFGSVTYFTKCFHDYFGFPPGKVGANNLTEHNCDEEIVDVNCIRCGKHIQEGENPEENPIPKRKQFKAIVLFITLLALISATTLYLAFKPFSIRQKQLEKTIAVLPFIDYSPNKGNSYIVNGLHEEILDKLAKIKDLKVKSHTAVEKFKDSKLSLGDIGKALKVNYILEGSGQKIQDKIRLRLQLIETGTGNHLWSKPFEEEVIDENIFKLQEDVALSVAEELKAIITPEEKKEVAKRHTENLTAYNLYLQSIEYLELASYNTNYGSKEINDLIMKAKQLLKQAIKLDPSFTDAYVRLGHIYIAMLSSDWNIDTSEQYLDSGITMVNKALFYDDKNGVAFGLQGQYYLRKGMYKEAKMAFAKSEQIEMAKMEDWSKYETYFWRHSAFNEYHQALENFYKFRELKPEEVIILPGTLNCVYTNLSKAGYPETAKKCLKEILDFDNDSVLYFRRSLETEMYAGNFDAAIGFGLECYRLDSVSFRNIYYLSRIYLYARDYSNAYKYLLVFENGIKKLNLVIPHLPEDWGYIYLMNNKTNEAKDQFKLRAKELQREIELNRHEAQEYYAQFHLATVFTPPPP